MGRGIVRRVRRTEEQWREVLRRFEASGLSTRAFCQREGISASSLQRWRSRGDRALAPRFVELAPPRATSAVSSTAWALELELPDGVRLRLRA